VDSTAVVAAMSEATPEPVKTFSVGFQTDSYNELPLARLTADRFSTDHHELMAEPDTVEVVPELVRHFGEPFADPGAIPAYYVAKLARRHVTVALNGDGGDEAFAGYTRYAAQVALARAGAVPLRVRRLLAQAAARLPNSGEIDSWTSRARRVGASLLRDPADRYIAYMTELNGLSRARLYKREYRELVGTSVADDVVAEPWAASSATNLIDRMLDVDRNTYLVDDLLVKMDIVTMANSLEARAPLLDQEFVAFAASLPPEQKLRGTRKKVGLRAALRGWIPDEVLDAPKRGFRPPIAEWLRGDLRVQAHDVLLDRTARERGYFEDGYVTELLRQHSDRRRDHSQAIWTLLNFELWHREFVDGVARHEPGGEAVSAVSARRDQS
jgi:asparagine synthase (glutamine-hydrolysing)